MPPGRSTRLPCGTQPLDVILRTWQRQIWWQWFSGISYELCEVQCEVDTHHVTIGVSLSPAPCFTFEPVSLRSCRPAPVSRDVASTHTVRLLRTRRLDHGPVRRTHITSMPLRETDALESPLQSVGVLMTAGLDRSREKWVVRQR